MRIIAPTALLAAALLVLHGCGTTYPKDTVAESACAVVKKEYNLESTARLKGKTLFLDIKLAGLSSTESGELSNVFKKLQGAVLVMTRIALSSDAKIEFLVVTARDPVWNLSLRVIQRLDDVKWYLYQRISKSDYEERLILEIEGGEKGALPSAFRQPTREPDREMTLSEFVGRLIVSQINMLGRNNPFLSVVLDNSQLKFHAISDDEVTIALSAAVNPSVLPLFESIVSLQSKKIIKKYDEWQPRKIRIVGRNNEVILTTVVR